MHSEQQASQAARWTAVCTPAEIAPNSGVCALIGDEQIAVFHVDDGSTRFFAIDNFDPNANAAVLSRGIVGNLGARLVVASPIFKQHFDLETGACLEAPARSVNAYPTRVEDGMVWVCA
jgi:nitrite reductase (NADH) small subunit